MSWILDAALWIGKKLFSSDSTNKVVIGELKLLFEEYKSKVKHLEEQGYMTDEENRELRANERIILKRMKEADAHNQKLKEDIISLQWEINRLNKIIEGLKHRGMYDP